MGFCVAASNRPLPIGSNSVVRFEESYCSNAQPVSGTDLTYKLILRCMDKRPERSKRDDNMAPARTLWQSQQPRYLPSLV